MKYSKGMCAVRRHHDMICNTETVGRKKINAKIGDVEDKEAR